MAETFAVALAAANELYAQGKNAEAAKKYGEVRHAAAHAQLTALGPVSVQASPNSSPASRCARHGRLQALKLADDKYKFSTQLSRARAYFRLGKYSRALSDCIEVLGSRDASLACSANQLKGCGIRCIC